jgi:methylenetetrahydrofolate reductase (NADPH)
VINDAGGRALGFFMPRVDAQAGGVSMTRLRALSRGRGALGLRRLRASGGSAIGDPQRAALIGFLERPRFEVLPLPGVEERVLAHLSERIKVTVTASPKLGLDATLGVTERLAEHGFTVVPHLSARLVRDEAHLQDVLDRLLAANVREVFVPAGDAPRAARFQSAAELLTAMGNRRAGFAEIGITGYPESHHLISDEATIEAMFAKAPMATYIVSQICFDPETIRTWIARVRARGTGLPIWIGLPGSIDQARLLRISVKIGLGASARFLRTHRGWLARVLTRTFTPDALVEALADLYADPVVNVGGFHLYTFNEVERTERWRRETIQRLASEG